jgi:hypothetical protein
MTPRTLKADIVLDGFRQAVPEYQEWSADSTRRNAFFVCALAVGMTREVTVSAEGEDLNGLRQFWEFARNNSDYRTVFTRYCELVTTDINNLWYEAYQAAEKPAHLLAPDVIQPDAPDDDELSADNKKKEANRLSA